MSRDQYFRQLELQFQNKANETAKKCVDNSVDDLEENELRNMVRYLSNQVLRLNKEIKDLKEKP